MSLPAETERQSSDNLAVSLFGGGLLFLLAISSWWVSGELDRARQLREQIHIDYQEIIELQRVFSLIQDVETGARGFALTKEPSYLKPYEVARARLPGELATLKRLLDSPQDLASFARLQKLEEERVNYSVHFVEDARAGRGVYQTGPGKAVMDQIRDVVMTMSRARIADVDSRLDEDRARGARTQNIVLSLFLTLMFGSLAVVLLLRRYLETRQHLVAAAESEALRQRAVFDAAMDGIVILNDRGHIERANPAAGRIFGRAPEELAGSSLKALLDPDSLAEIETVVESRRGASAEAVRREAGGIRKDGSRFPLEVSIAAMTDGATDSVLAFMRDISERREVEQMKDEFVSTVSHELRTPLTSIAGSLGLIAGGAAGALPEKATRLIGIAQANSQRLVRLINDVLDLEKLESGKLPFHFVSVDLVEVASRAIDGARGYADQLDVEVVLEAETHARVNGDVDRLVQVVTNLLSNAAKYSPKKGLVTVKVAAEGESAHLSVSDRGPGVPEAFRDRIFTRFAQADASDARGKSGTGLGLYIAKEIAERHGGRLWFESPAGGGARFHLDLPLETRRMSESIDTRDHVLLVEDEPAAAALLTAILEHEGLKVDTAGTLAEARAALNEAGRYGALVLDLRLPDGDGMDLVREIRKRTDVRGIPIVVVSADAARGKDPAVRTLDVVDWMEKPVDPDRLAELVRGAIGPGKPGNAQILHIDDDRDIRELVATALAGIGDVVSAQSLVEARTSLKERRPDLVVLDLELRDGSGLDFLDDLRRQPGDPIPVIVFSAQDTGDLGQQVAAVLVKSKTSLAGLVGAVRELVRAPEDARP